MFKPTKIYFASDFHFGAMGVLSNADREKLVIRWLDEVSKDATEIYLVGDIFDFWFEYKYVVPKGCVRLLGKLAQLVDNGIELHIFTGNHDMWMFGYLEEELGAKLYKEPIKKTYNGKTFLIGHGDGLGPGDRGYKMLKVFFANKFCQWLLARVHPNLTFAMAQHWSKKSRITNLEDGEVFTTAENEWLYQYCKEILEKEHIDYFIFGHRHLALDLKIENTESRYINLGEWVTNQTHYACFDGETLQLLKYN